jgi:hypothetical protein
MPEKHKYSYSLNIKNKTIVLSLLKQTHLFLRVDKKRNRALWILKHYENVTPRNGKYTSELLERKIAFEEAFFQVE